MTTRATTRPGRAALRGTILLLCSLCALPSEARKPRRIEVHGHRGARALRPENTLSAFDYALSVGVDVLELDLGVTADDRVVVLHDQQINPALCRMSTKHHPPAKYHPPVRTLTLAQLRAYDCGSIANPRFPRQRRVAGAKIPTLEQVLTLVRRSRYPSARRVQLNIETKIVPGYPRLAPSPKRFVELVVAVLRKHKMLHRSMLQSFDHRTLLATAKLAPELRRVALVASNRPDLLAVARAAKAAILSPNHRWISADDVRRAQRAGLRVVPWTANRAQDWDRLIKIGVDGIITDDPAALIKHLAQRKLR